MKVSYNWLQDYLPIEAEIDELSKVLTGTGLEVGSIVKVEPVTGGLEGLVVGEVLKVDKHPNADRLTICKVKVAPGEERSIVCGAPNIKQGQKVVVALSGTTIYPTNAEPFTIKKGKIRGEVSEGMICAEDEIGIGQNHDGILVLDSSAMIGTSLRNYYKIKDDFAIEIDLTPNRTDAISHFGVARDFLAVKNLTSLKNDAIRIPDVTAFKIDNEEFKIEVTVEDHEACPRYSGLSMSGIKVSESPDWLKDKLKTVGLKPINNIVDAANFIMYETGQPLHVFDADQIKGQKVLVRKLKEGTSFVTLDGEERKLDKDDLMICNPEGGMCIAGVFGGLTSGVTDKTERIFIESAYFHGSGIRKTAKRHGLSTDASYRYERGANIESTIYALKRLSLLIKELTGAQITSDIIDVYPNKKDRNRIEFRWTYLNQISGQVIAPAEATNILISLGFEISKESSEGVELIVPPYRVDVTREIDVVEEVLRIYGYNNIEIPKRMQSAISFSEDQDGGIVRRKVSAFLSSRGFREVMNNSLTSKKHLIKDQPGIEITNPLSSELSVMRMSLNPGGLESIRYNINRKSSDLMLFEFGKVYSLLDEASFKEQFKLGLWMTGEKGNLSWKTTATPVDFYDLKESLELLLRKLGLGIGSLKVRETKIENADFGLAYFIGKKELARILKHSEEYLKQMEIEQAVYSAEIDWNTLLIALSKLSVSFESLPKYPSVRRDLALLLDESVQYDQVERIAKDVENRLLKEVSLFDVYRGKGVDPDKKSYAVSFLFRDDNKTLTDAQIDKVMKKFIDRFQTELGAELR
ncbi:MAG: phenylalanine--tRNA ligase subunit beta [Vicingaceae bacterium]